MVYSLVTLILCNDAPGLKFSLDFFFLLPSLIFERRSGLFLRRENVSLHHLGPSFPSPWLPPLILSGETSNGELLFRASPLTSWKPPFGS